MVYNKLKTWKKWLFFATAALIGIAPVSSAENLAATPPIRILSTSAEAAKWEKALKDMGYKDVKIIAERDRPLDEAKHKVKGEDLAENTILIAPNSWIEGYHKVIEDFVKNGGKVIATKAAGYCEGKFYLTELLKTGKKNLSLPLFYPTFIKDDEQHSKFKKVVEWCYSKNPDGAAIFEYCQLNMKRWKSDKPDLTGLCKQVFADFDQLKKGKESLTPLGLPEVPKVVYVAGWASERFPIPPEELVDSIYSMGGNVIDIVVIGGERYAMYDSQYPYSRKKTFDNYLPRLIEAAKSKGIQIWANIGFSPKAYGPECKERQLFQSGKTGSTFCALAAKEWYENNYLPIVRELMEKHPYINVLTLDEPRIACRSNIDWGCFCDACKKKFKEKYGYELTPDIALSRDFMEFREDVMSEYLIKPLSEMLHSVNPKIQLGFWDWPCYEILGITPRKASDAGLNIFGTEYMFEMYDHKGKSYMLDGEDSSYIQMGKGFDCHSVILFDFKKLVKETEHPVIKNVNMEQVSGKGIQLDVFNGAQVIAWIGNGSRSYPGIVSANNGKTLYFSFDPAALETQEGNKIIKNAIDFMSGNPH